MKTLPLIPIVAAACLVSYVQAEASTANVQEQLVTACQAGDVSGIKAALKAGAAVDGTPDDDFSPLMHACLKGHLEAVKLLLAAGADINLRLKVTRDALGAALFSNHPAIAHYLIEQGALDKLEADHSPQGNTQRLLYLKYAAQTGLTDFVKLFLDAGVPVEEAATALTSASQNGHADIVRLLIERGVDVNQPVENNFTTALPVACLYGHADCVRLLLDAGALAQTDTTLSKGIATPLNLAVQGAHYDCVMLLLDAVQAGKLDLDLDSFNMYGQNALMRACYKNEFTIALALINAGAKHGLSDDDGYTVLIVLSCACEPVAYQVCVELIRRGASINDMNKAGESALIMASKHGNRFLVDLLLKLGADASLKDEKGYSALDYAQQCKRAEIMDLLAQPAVAKPSAEAQAQLLELASKNIKVLPESQALLMEAIALGDKAKLDAALAKGADINASSYCLAPEGRGFDFEVDYINTSSGEGLTYQPAEEKKQSRARFSPLSYAAALNQVDMLKYLLQKGADANHLVGYSDSAFLSACDWKHREAIDALTKGARLKPLNAAHDTQVLASLFYMGMHEHLKQLSQAGWQWSARDIGDWLITALVRDGRLDDLKELVDLGFNLVDVDDKSQHRSLFASLQEDHLDVMQYLLELGWNPNTKGAHPISLLGRVCVLKNEAAIKLLLKHGAVSLGTIDEYKLIIATLKQMQLDDELMQFARLENAYSPATHPEREAMLLLHAFAAEDLETLRLCIAAGADPNSIYQGKTLLMIAAEAGNLTLVEFLIEQGADIKATDKYGDDARLYALGAGHSNVVDYLDKAATAKQPAKP